jgi:hypothetical protein
MYQLFNTPIWFNGYDLVFEFLAVIITLMIARYGWKVYKYTHEKKQFYLSLAFLSIGLGLLIKIGTYAILYYAHLRTKIGVVVGLVAPTRVNGILFSDLLYRTAFFGYMFMFLSAVLLLFLISQKSRDRLKKLYELSQIALFAYLIALIALVANFYYFIFYLTATVILSLTVLNYYKNYLNNNNINTLKIMFSFLILMIANIFFVCVLFNNLFYVLGEIFTLLAFLMLLNIYRKIKNGQ